jgi:hypothetical protein
MLRFLFPRFVPRISPTLSFLGKWRVEITRLTVAKIKQTLPNAVNAAQTKAAKHKLEGQKREETDGNGSGLQVAMQQSFSNRGSSVGDWVHLYSTGIDPSTTPTPTPMLTPSQLL